MSARVLVIDDSPISLEFIRSALEQCGIDSDEACDLASLNVALARQSYDLILIDVNMPEVYGDDVVEYLKKQKHLRSTLLLYSDLSVEELEQRVQSSGADGYITKSGDLETAIAAIQDALRNRAKSTNN
jgi:DNA-binding response OmpR family regulator